MENAADALKIAFAALAFIIAITLTFSLISQAKSTADVVLYHSDETNYYEHLDSGENNRTVSVSEVISNLHRYYKESIGITIKLENETYVFDLNNNETILTGLSKLSSENDRKENLAQFINTKLLTLQDAKFTEEFTEVPISGIYKTGEDGTEITIASGGKKVYITYTKQ